jgi:hypothetical protein
MILTLTFVLAIVEILALKGGLSSLSADLTIRYPHEHTHVSVPSLGRPAVRAAWRCTIEGGLVGGVSFVQLAVNPSEVEFTLVMKRIEFMTSIDPTAAAAALTR